MATESVKCHGVPVVLDTLRRYAAELRDILKLSQKHACSENLPFARQRFAVGLYSWKVSRNKKV
jgi:hypothetical protein